MSENFVFTKQNFLSVDECKQFAQNVLDNMNEWIEGFGQYTLGRAWYIDIEQGRLGTYFATAFEKQAVVQQATPGLSQVLQRAATFLPRINGELHQVRTRSDDLGPYWSEMGIHIMGHNLRFGGQVHNDLEGLAPYPAMMFDHKTLAFSAILCLAAPKSGGGLKVWPEKRITALANAQGAYKEDKGPELVIEYKPGTLTIIDSFLYHQIQPFEVDAQNLWRIVAVMHFLFIDGPEPHWQVWF